MLAVTREPGQDILISDDIVITFIGFKGSKAVIGIKAPKHVKIYRRELFEAIQREKSAADRVARANQCVAREACA